MKKILLLSDTHGYIDDAILKHVNQADEVWHAGDIGDLKVTDSIKKLKPLQGVYGNIDIWITHIGGYPPKYNNRVRDELVTNPPDIFITGHSHILKVMPDKKLNLLHMNPGAAGKHGFHKIRTMLRFKIDGKQIKDLEVIEFEKR
jgi:predicted phosphodiesterase